MHLVVLTHGLWGNAGHLAVIEKSIHEAFKDAVSIININIFEGSYTYDGIDVNGQKVISQIRPELEKGKYKTISFVGYSLGGLILRYTIGILYKEGVFDYLEPLFYISFASPHLGTRKPHNTGKVFNFLQDIYLVRVGKQFSLTDTDAGRPLLVVMADPKECFMKGLSLFRHQVLFVNTRADRSVPFTTGSISSTNPYKKFKKRVIDPMKYPSIVTFEDGELIERKNTAPFEKLIGISGLLIFAVLLCLIM